MMKRIDAQNFDANETRKSDEQSEHEGMFAYPVREVVGVFSTEQAMADAIEELMLQGFNRRQISVLAARHRIKRTIAELEDSPYVEREGYASSHSRVELEAAVIGLPIYVAGLGSYAAVIASGGTLAFAIAALILAGAAGGGAGGLLAHTIGQHHRSDVARQLSNGGLVVWVSVRDSQEEETASACLERRGARDIHTHEIARAWGIEDVPFYDVQPDPLLENDH
jgi:hypothetical protein